MIIGNFIKKPGNYLYFIARVLIGFLFFSHGLQKLFGLFTENASAELFSLMGLAGLIELIFGAFIALGILTRLSALISALEMLIAYFKSHAAGGLVPIMNRGELSLLYFAVFLIILVYGAKKWGLEKAIFKKEIF